MMFEADTIDPVAGITATADRRRPGRTGSVPALISLLRNPVGDGLLHDEAAIDQVSHDPVAPSRGIALALVLCLPIWFSIGALLYGLLW